MLFYEEYYFLEEFCLKYISVICNIELKKYLSCPKTRMNVLFMYIVSIEKGPGWYKTIKYNLPPSCNKPI